MNKFIHVIDIVMNTHNDIKEKIELLRNEGLSIRQIAKKQNVSKYTVEKIVKELQKDSLSKLQQTIEEDRQTHQPFEGKTGQTGVNLLQNGNQTVQTNGNLQLNGYNDSTELQLKGQLNTEEEPLNKQIDAYFPGIYGFMTSYRVYLRALLQVTYKQRNVWQHVLQNKYLKQLADLKKRAELLSTKYGQQYNGLLLSDVFNTIESYLHSAPVVTTVISGITFKSIKLPLDIQLLDLCERALKSDFFHQNDTWASIISDTGDASENNEFLLDTVNVL